MDRFGKVALKIRRLIPEVAIHHLITTLWLGPFADNLAMHPTSDMDDLRQRATKYMQVEELREFARAE